MELKLSKCGSTVLVDDEDADKCRAMQRGRDGLIYVRWWVGDKQVRTALHRHILAAKKGTEIDHINGNTFDNRKCNLRFATRSQNQCNRDRPRKKLLHPYRGIGFFPNHKNKWAARVKLNGKTHSAGYYPTIEEAARAYDVLAKKLHGEFARLNFK